MTLRQIVMPAAILFALAALTGCSVRPPVASQAVAPIEIRANTGAVESAPVLLAARDFMPAALEVGRGAIPNLIGAPNIAGVFDPGPADVATHAETQALRYSVDHPEIRIILTATEGEYRIVARRSAGIASISDLKGKRIGTLPNTSADFFVHRMLAHNGIGADELTIQRVSIADMADALVARQVDAIAIWDPYGADAARAIGADLITFSDPDVYRERFNLNSTSERLADPAKRRAIVRFVRAVIDASTALKDDPSRAQALIAERSGFSPEQVAGAWPHLRFPAAIPGDLLDAMVVEEQWLAQRAERTPRSREELAGLIDHSVYEEAMALELER
ncbi:ABC transporter substrate-binding protein [Parasphingorhabdus sp.]|uniref:ABC transporter substrate-binding protein n=1 Tax=Parasphingorhabdus sp. TaxID=2709688 RepID=UPI003A8DD001